MQFLVCFSWKENSETANYLLSWSITSYVNCLFFQEGMPLYAFSHSWEWFCWTGPGMPPFASLLHNTTLPLFLSKKKLFSLYCPLIHASMTSLAHTPQECFYLCTCCRLFPWRRSKRQHQSSNGLIFFRQMFTWQLAFFYMYMYLCNIYKICHWRKVLHKMSSEQHFQRLLCGHKSPFVVPVLRFLN